MQLWTTKGYLLSAVVSALQKSIRRGDAKMACYWACEMWQSGYDRYLWRRLLVISAEDCFGCVTHEIVALRDAYLVINEHKKGLTSGIQFGCKAAYLLARAAKSRDNDHAVVLQYRNGIGITEEELKAEIAANADVPMTDFPIPWEAWDFHTGRGRKAGHTKNEFIVREHEALTPHEPGLFDKLVDHVRDNLTDEEKRLLAQKQ
jgi:hypothetical protein